MDGRPLGADSLAADASTGVGSSLAATNVLIGIDDTDNSESRGTGHLAQQLLAALTAEGLGRALGATRHQLLVDPRIPYTSHNSSACIAWDGGPEPDVEAIVAFTGAFLESRSATGSDPGLAVAAASTRMEACARGALTSFGRRAKREVLDQPQARETAAACGVRLSGHGGTNDGIIGALAAVGLHLSGADGLFLWMPGIRALDRESTYAALLARVPIDIARDPTGNEPGPEDFIELGDWVRPVMDGGRAVLLLRGRTARSVSAEIEHESTKWEVAPRADVKAHSHQSRR